MVDTTADDGRHQKMSGFFFLWFLNTKVLNWFFIMSAFVSLF